MRTCCPARAFDNLPGVGDKYAADPESDGESLRAFTNKVLRDLRALEMLLASGAFESGIRRIGAEQECFLVDRSWHPAPSALKIMSVREYPKHPAA